MRHRVLIALSAGIVLASCGTVGGGNGTAASTAPVHRKPGSWSSKIEIAKLEGKDVKPGTREQMQQMFNMMSGMSVCVTPEAAAQEDISKNLEQSAGSSDCKFDKREVNGGTIDFAATCERGTNKTRLAAHGTNTETAQDITMKVEKIGTTGEAEGVMEMHVTSTYNGACKPGDLTPPPAPKDPAKP